MAEFGLRRLNGAGAGPESSLGQRQSLLVQRFASHVVRRRVPERRGHPCYFRQSLGKPRVTLGNRVRPRAQHCC